MTHKDVLEIVITFGALALIGWMAHALVGQAVQFAGG